MVFLFDKINPEILAQGIETTARKGYQQEYAGVIPAEVFPVNFSLFRLPER